MTIDLSGSVLLLSVELSCSLVLFLLMVRQLEEYWADRSLKAVQLRVSKG